MVRAACLTMFFQSALSLYIYTLTKTFGMVLHVAIVHWQMFLWAIMEEELVSMLLPEICFCLT